MLSKRRKHPQIIIWQARVLCGVLIIVTIFALRTVYERYTIERDMAARRAAVEADLSELLERRAALEERVKYLQHERGIEAEMRRQFDVARAGEQIVIIVDDEPVRTEGGIVAGTTTEQQSSARPWYKFW